MSESEIRMLVSDELAMPEYAVGIVLGSNLLFVATPEPVPDWAESNLRSRLAVLYPDLLVRFL